jgi:hypothetical protein
VLPAHRHDVDGQSFQHVPELGWGHGQVYDGPDEVSEYFRRSRVPFPDQHNEVIALHHAEDAVITE